MKKSCLLLLPLLYTGMAQATGKLTVVLDWNINTNHTGLFVAEKLGYFKEEDLDVSIETPPETGGAAMVLTGSAQIGVSYQEEITMARAAGRSLTAIAAIVQHNTSGFASRATASIKSAKDFSGKSYGGWGSPIEEAMVRALVQQDGGDPDTVEIVPIGAMDFFAATEDAIDFVWVFEAWDVVAAGIKGIDINYIPLATVPELDYYTPVLAAEGKWLEQNGDTTKAFLRAVSKGYQYAIDNPADAAKLLLEVAPELDEPLVNASQDFLASQYQADAPRWGEMSLERWEGYTKWLMDNDLLIGGINESEAFSNEYLP